MKSNNGTSNCPFLFTFLVNKNSHQYIESILCSLHLTALFPPDLEYRKQETDCFCCCCGSSYSYRKKNCHPKAEEKKDNNRDDDDIRERFVRTHNHTYTNTPFCQKKNYKKSNLHFSSFLIQKNF